MKANILIVEDEVLIAHSVATYLKGKGYDIAGTAISYDRAVALLQSVAVDLVLVDIRLSGPKSGIDLVKYISESYPSVMSVYLTSQFDPYTMQLVRETRAAGYITKPIQFTTLYTTMEMVLSNKSHIKTVTVHASGVDHLLRLTDITHCEAEHVYVRVHIKDKESLLVRSSLKEFHQLLDPVVFARVHRSCIINLQWLTSIGRDTVVVDTHTLPVSRSYLSDLKSKYSLMG